MLFECKLNRLYSNIINVLRNIYDIDFEATIEKEDVSFFIDYLLQYGIHGNSNNETSLQASVHNNKFKFFISRVFLTNKSYRITRYSIFRKLLVLNINMLNKLLDIFNVS